jgi:sialidase-1
MKPSCPNHQLVRVLVSSALWAGALALPPCKPGEHPPCPGFPHITPGCLPDSPGRIDLWCPGDQLESTTYECYKIPSLLRIPDSGILLSFIEARRFSCSDSGWIDLLLKTSGDGGRTWSQPTLVVSDAGLRSNASEWHTIGDALPVYDAATRLIHLVFTRDNEDAFVTVSRDLGRTWGAPRNISSEALPERGPFCGTGHAAGLQLAQSGRLLVPMYCQGNAAAQVGGHAFALLSDDHGRSWRRGGDLGNASGNEWVAAEVPHAGGQLLASLRSAPARLQAHSADGGESWSTPVPARELPEPVSGCEGALVAHPNGNLYYSHPDEHVLRQVMNVKASEDGGQTWRQHTQLWGVSAGCEPPCVPAASYSSMSVLGDEIDSEIGILYMRNNATMLIFEGRGVTFQTFKP